MNQLLEETLADGAGAVLHVVSSGGGRSEYIVDLRAMVMTSVISGEARRIVRRERVALPPCRLLAVRVPDGVDAGRGVTVLAADKSHVRTIVPAVAAGDTSFYVRFTDGRGPSSVDADDIELQSCPSVSRDASNDSEYGARVSPRASAEQAAKDAAGATSSTRPPPSPADYSAALAEIIRFTPPATPPPSPPASGAASSSSTPPGGTRIIQLKRGPSFDRMLAAAGGPLKVQHSIA